MASRKLEVEFIGDTKNLERAFGRVSKKGSGAFSGLGRAAKTAGVVVGGAAIAAGASMIDLASDAQETASKFKTVFGREAGRAVKQLDEFSKATGTSRFELREQAAQFQALIRPMGLTTKNAASMATGMTQLATDLASFNNSSVQEAMTALQSGLVGESEPLRRFGVQLSANRIEAFAYAEGIAKQGKELTAAQKAEAAYGIILKDTKLAQGDATKTADSFANQFKRVKAQVKDAGTELGVQLLPTVTAVVGAMSGFIDQMRSGEGLGGRLAGVFKSVASALVGLVTGFRDGEPLARALVSTMAGAAAAFAGWKVLGGIAAGITAVKKAWELATLAFSKNPVGLVLTAFAAISGALGVFSLNTDSAVASTRDLTDAFRAQADAMRAVRDIDIDVAQRKANLKSANVGVEQAERRLKDLRKDGNATALDVKQAEADLQQARVSARRASRDLARAEEDGKRIRQDGARATQDANKKLQGLIDKKKDDLKETGDQIRTTEDQIGVLKRQGFNTDRLKDKVDDLRGRQASLRKEIERLEDKRVTVAVKFSLNPAPQSKGPNGQMRPGDGWGVENSLQKLAQGAVDSGKLMPGLGSMPASGTGLNAFNGIASRFGLTVGSGFRPGSITSSGNLSYHAMGRARDFPGTPAAMLAFAQFMAANFGARLKELIHTPLGFSIKNGARVAPYAQADHYDHVHVAMRKGGKVPGSGAGDRMPALLEPGEFVVRKSVVDKLGLGFFAGLNGMRKGGRVGKNTVATLEAIGVASRMSRRLPLIEQSLALAELTADLGDDAAALDELVRYWQGQLMIAQARGRGVTAAARGLKSAQDQRAGLTPVSQGPDPAAERLAAAIEEQNRLTEQKIAIDTQIRDNQLKILALGGQGDQIVAAVVAAVNGGIGGRVGLGFHGIRSAPGSVAAL